MDKVIESEGEIKNEKEMEYIKQLSPLQKVAYEIAKTHLKSSFCVEKSIGYLELDLDLKLDLKLKLKLDLNLELKLDL